MKKIIAILLSIMIISGLSACAPQENAIDNENGSVATPGNGMNDENNTEEPGEEKQLPELIISGIVKYNEIESGFYEVDGYRLIGDYEFETYVDKFVIAVGNEDNSPSIYMVKAIDVRNMILKDEKDFEPQMNELISEFEEALTAAETSGEDKEKTELISNNLAMLQLILSKNIKIEAGNYVGQADNNFIEIDMDVTEAGEAMRTFQLSDEIREAFPSMNFEKGDSVEIKYQERENQNPLLLKIEKK